MPDIETLTSGRVRWTDLSVVGADVQSPARIMRSDLAMSLEVHRAQRIGGLVTKAARLQREPHLVQHSPAMCPSWCAAVCVCM